MSYNELCDIMQRSTFFKLIIYINQNMNIIKPAEISSNLKKRLPDIIIGALTLVAGLAWNDAFQDTINNWHITVSVIDGQVLFVDHTVTIGCR